MPTFTCVMCFAVFLRAHVHSVVPLELPSTVESPHNTVAPHQVASIVEQPLEHSLTCTSPRAVQPSVIQPVATISHSTVDLCLKRSLACVSTQAVKSSVTTKTPFTA